MQQNVSGRVYRHEGARGPVWRAKYRLPDGRHSGVAPLDASSGRRQRHRLNRTGNRRLNRALYTIVLTQIRVHPPARAYMARRATEGKTPREALRALKRHLIRTIYRLLAAEPTAPTPIRGRYLSQQT